MLKLVVFLCTFCTAAIAALVRLGGGADGGHAVRRAR